MSSSAPPPPPPAPRGSSRLGKTISPLYTSLAGWHEQLQNRPLVVWSTPQHLYVSLACGSLYPSLMDTRSVQQWAAMLSR